LSKRELIRQMDKSVTEWKTWSATISVVASMSVWHWHNVNPIGDTTDLVKANTEWKTLLSLLMIIKIMVLIHLHPRRCRNRT
jgi:hypothetical protein